LGLSSACGEGKRRTQKAAVQKARENPSSSFISIDSNENLITKGWLFKLRRVIFLPIL